MKNSLEPLKKVLINIAIVLGLYAATRIAFIIGNHNAFPGLTVGKGLSLCLLGIPYDLAAILLLSIPYAVMALFPFTHRSKKIYKKLCKGLFIIPNFVGIGFNVYDITYFDFDNRRTTATFFKEFSNESNAGTIVFEAIVDFWYLFVMAAVIIYIMYRFYQEPKRFNTEEKGYKQSHSAITAGFFAVAACFLLIFYIADSKETLTYNGSATPLDHAIVTNTPLEIGGTLNGIKYEKPGYYKTNEELESAYTPIHIPDTNNVFKNKNVCVLIMESFSASYSTFLKREQGSGQLDGYMPFLDSLMEQSLVYRWSFANGRKSCEAMPSSLSGIPSLIEPFFLAPYYSDKLSGIAGELSANKGYSSAFFHGAPKGSMGFADFASKTGFNGQFDKSTFGDDSYFDGTWAIWDEPFLQYYAAVMSEMPEPFVTSIFTASSHHPFKVPSQYKGKFKKGPVPMHQAIGYSDYSLRRFFETARDMDWFNNTLFVITGDHTSITKQKDYSTNYGVYEIPIVFYDPSGELFQPEIRDGIAQQADIMPTVLGLLGYDQPYLAFGCDLSSTPDEETYAVNYLYNCYQYFEGDYVLQYDGKKVIGLYDFRKDRYQSDNLKSDLPEVRDRMLKTLKGIIQQYIDRMVDDRLTYFQ